MRGLPKKVKQYLEKGRDAALLAVEVYNKPAVHFKSSAYITLMVMAWTALFHAIFFKQKKKPFYKSPNGRFIKKDGDLKHWELDECLRQYYQTDTQNPVKKNLEFFIPLRNKIEHRYLPELDSDIFGECQAMLFNFDELVEKNFDKKYCLRECLSFSLQLFPSSKTLVDAAKSNPYSISDFITQYRSTIDNDVLQSGKYSFKAFLIQVANHQGTNVLPIQFFHYDKLSDQEKKDLSSFATMIKYKELPVANADKLKVSEVIKRVQHGLGNQKIQKGKKLINKFNTNTHTRCWRKYKVRPDSKSPKPELTERKFCIYDKPHNDYLYSQEWVDFLIETLKDDREFSALYK